MAQAMQSAAMAGLTSTSNDMKDRISSLFEELECVIEYECSLRTREVDRVERLRVRWRETV